jgi:hypothetical protein
VPLELREVVEQRRLLRGGLLLGLLHDAGPAPDLLRYLLGSLAVVQAVLLALEPHPVVGVLLAAEAGVDGPELLGLEVLYLPLALDEELEGRGLDAAHGEDVAGAAEADGVGAGGVHADDPVGLAAAARRVFEWLHAASRRARRRSPTLWPRGLGRRSRAA